MPRTRIISTLVLLGLVLIGWATTRVSTGQPATPSSPDGRMIVEFSLPPLPADATITEAEYRERALEQYSKKEKVVGLVPARGMWSAMKGVPTDAAGWSAFTKDALAATLIDPDDVTISTVADPTTYCITTGAQIECYFKMTPTWTGAGTNPFEFQVVVGGASSPVTVEWFMRGTFVQNLPD